MVTIKKIEIKGFFGKGDFEWNLNPVVNILWAPLLEGRWKGVAREMVPGQAKQQSRVRRWKIEVKKQDIWI